MRVLTVWLLKIDLDDKGRTNKNIRSVFLNLLGGRKRGCRLNFNTMFREEIFSIIQKNLLG